MCLKILVAACKVSVDIENISWCVASFQIIIYSGVSVK